MGHLARTTAALALAAGVGVAQAGKAHEHGIARLDVAVDPTRVTLLLEMPLDSLLGFERAPRTDAERALADAAIAKLRAAATLFRIDSAAQCGAARVELRSASLGLGGAGEPANGHDDVEASIEFSCKDGNKAGFVEVGLFDAFARLQRIDVQTATRKGQLKATLQRPTSRVPLAK
jgi:hypothetical protein